MGSDIQVLELASGIKDSSPLTPYLAAVTTEISKILGIDSYIAQLIFGEAEKVRASAIVRALSKDNDVMT